MPNHIINKVKPSKKFGEIKKRVAGKSDFDFNKIVSMPEELRETQSPAWIVSDEKYQEELEKAKKEREKDSYKSLPISESMSKDFMRRFGANDWYDWANKNWGTKWNAYEIIVEGEMFEFQTAWSTPLPVLVALSRLFDDVEFYVEYADEDLGSNCGTYTLLNGNIIAEQDEDKKFACELWGYEYFEFDCEECGECINHKGLCDDCKKNKKE